MRKSLFWLVAGLAVLTLGCAGPRQIFPAGGSAVPKLQALKLFRSEASASYVRFQNCVDEARMRIKFRHQGFGGGIWLEDGATIDILLSEGVNEYYVYVDSDRTGRQVHTDWRTIYVNPRNPRSPDLPSERVVFSRRGSWYTGVLVINEQRVRTRPGDMYDNGKRR